MLDLRPLIDLEMTCPDEAGTHRREGRSGPRCPVFAKSRCVVRRYPPWGTVRDSPAHKIHRHRQTYEVACLHLTMTSWTMTSPHTGRRQLIESEARFQNQVVRSTNGDLNILKKRIQTRVRNLFRYHIVNYIHTLMLAIKILFPRG